MANYLIGYPRSGNNWCQNRLVLFYHKCLNKVVSLGGIVPIANISHFGYGASNAEAVLELSDVKKLKPDDQIFCHLRDAKAVLNSYCFYMNGVILPNEPGLVLPKTPDELVKSSWGVSRLCRFMNELEGLKAKVKKITFLHYEDAFLKEFIKVLPLILGIDYQMSEEEIEWIYKNSDFETIKNMACTPDCPSEIKNIFDGMDLEGKKRYRVGTVNSYKKSMSTASCDYVDNYLRQHCKLPEYRSRY